MARPIIAVVLSLAACRPGRAWDREVAKLDGLSVQCTSAEFLERRPLRELLAAVDEPVPALERGLRSPSWSIRASCIYILLANELGTGTWIGSFANDPHPFVRALAASYVGSAHDWGGDILLRPAEKAIAERCRVIEPATVPISLPEELYLRRLDRLFLLACEPSPLAETDGLRSFFKTPLKGLPYAGQYGVIRALSDGRAGHSLIDRIAQHIARIPPEQEDHLGLFLEIASRIPEHRDPAHGGLVDWDCAHGLRALESILEVAAPRVARAKSRYLLDEGMSFLSNCGHAHSPSIQALRTLASGHTDPEVRRMASLKLDRMGGR